MMRSYETSTSPVDATTYYMGGFNSTQLATVTTFAHWTAPVKGIIRVAQIEILSSVTTGTNEDWTFEIINNTSTVVETIATLGAATATRVWRNGNMGLPVEAGDSISIRTTTPTWVTNPDGCRGHVLIFIEYA